MAELLLGLDLGTTGTKAALFETGRGVLGTAMRPSPLHAEHPGWAEADTSTWWENVCAVVREVSDTANVASGDIKGVACSGMVPAVVVLDRDRKPLRRAILQNDARAVAEIAEIEEALTAAAFDPLVRTGSALTQQSVAPTWRWLTRHEPEVAEQAATIVGSYDWLAITLGAAPHVEANWALESGLYGLDGARCDVVARAAGLDGQKLPGLRRPGERIGEVSTEAAHTSGLSAGTPIFAGGADHVLAAFAAGLGRPGDWLVKLGGAGDILVVSDEPAIDRRWYLDEHPEPGLWLPNGCMATSGSLLRWTQQVLGSPPLAMLDDEAEEASPASIVCLPYFLGEKSPLHDPDLRGAFVGLHLGHGRADLYRSCLEAVAYGFRQHVEIFAAAGLELGEARVSNGGSGSMLWKRILADVLGVALRPIKDHGGAALGAALVAGVGSGELGSWADAARYVALGDPIEPQANNRVPYEEGYAIFCSLQESLRPAAHRLAEASRR